MISNTVVACDREFGRPPDKEETGTDMRKHMSTKSDFGWMFLTGLGIGLTTIGFVRLIRNRLTLHEAMVLLQQEDNAGNPVYTRTLNRLADRLGLEDANELREKWHKVHKPLARAHAAGNGN